MKSRSFSRSIVVLVLLGSLWTPLLVGRITHSFHPKKLRLPPHCKENVSDKWFLSPEIEKILGGEFSYLGRGSQSYVWESRDRRTVVKFLRYNRSRFLFLHNVKRWVHRKDPKKVKLPLFEKTAKTLDAFEMAFREARDCTGLLYVHLNVREDSFLPTITLRNSWGRCWELPLARYRFVVQQKAVPLQTALLAARGEERKKLCDSLLDLLVTRASRHLRNSDHNLWPNFGVIGGRVFEIDCGNYRKRLALQDPALRAREILRFAEPLLHWLEKHDPECAAHVALRLHNITYY